MRTCTTGYGRMALALAALMGVTVNANETPLELQGKSVEVFPVLLGEPGKSAASDDPQEMNVRIAEVLGLMLEQAGMLPTISSNRSAVITTEGDLTQMETGIRSFLSENKPQSDHVLFARILGTRAKEGPSIDSVCAVLTDAKGEIIWSKDCAQSEEGTPHNPMDACVRIAQSILSVSDLTKPDPNNVPDGEMAERMRRRSGVPPRKAIETMEGRFEKARGTFNQASLTIYPVRVWGVDAGSTEGAQELADKLNNGKLFQSTRVASTDTELKAKPNPNQMKILWDSARMFRKYLREHPADTDYALLVDATVPAHHLHLILCKGSGEWVMVDFQNSHHPDFNEIAPKTIDDVVALAVRRLQERVKD